MNTFRGIFYGQRAFVRVFIVGIGHKKYQQGMTHSTVYEGNKLGLFGKWLWRFPLEEEAWWVKIIRSIRGLRLNGWDLNVASGVSLKSFWKGIQKALIFFSQDLRIEEGNGG